LSGAVRRRPRGGAESLFFSLHILMLTVLCQTYPYCVDTLQGSQQTEPTRVDAADEALGLGDCGRRGCEGGAHLKCYTSVCSVPVRHMPLTTTTPRSLECAWSVNMEVICGCSLVHCAALVIFSGHADRCAIFIWH
jgi:hypothetical protein